MINSFYMKGIVMTNKIMIIIGVFVIVGVLCFIFKDSLFNKTNFNPKQLELTYEINAGIPFKWEHEIEDDSIVKFVKSYVVKDENTGGKVGASVYTNYVFESVKPGTTTIKFKFVNFADNYVSGERKHVITVDKDLNISLVKEDKGVTYFE